jgi:proton-coupled amino acid transporter
MILPFTGPPCSHLKGSDWWVLVGDPVVVVLISDGSQVIPITDSMREPRRFPAVLTGVMIFLTSVYLLSF